MANAFFAGMQQVALAIKPYVMPVAVGAVTVAAVNRVSTYSKIGNQMEEMEWDQQLRYDSLKHTIDTHAELHKEEIRQFRAEAWKRANAIDTALLAVYAEQSRMRQVVSELTVSAKPPPPALADWHDGGN